MVNKNKNLSFGRSGPRDWLWQRATAVVMFIYLVVMVGFFCSHPQLDYGTWKHWLGQSWVSALTFLFILSLLYHAWIGMWIVLTDYIKCARLRLTLQFLIIAGLLLALAYALRILWGVVA